MMTYRQIESSRETRLWITQVLFPILIMLGMILRNPETRRAAVYRINGIGEIIKSKFTKKD